jgi:hypothetical protein
MVNYQLVDNVIAGDSNTFEITVCYKRAKCPNYRPIMNAVYGDEVLLSPNSQENANVWQSSVT